MMNPIQSFPLNHNYGRTNKTQQKSAFGCKICKALEKEMIPRGLEPGRASATIDFATDMAVKVERSFGMTPNPEAVHRDVARKTEEGFKKAIAEGKIDEVIRSTNENTFIKIPQEYVDKYGKKS